MMYLYEALKAEDQKEFVKAMDIEISGHEKGEHWVVVPHTSVPKGTRVPNAVWALCRKT